LGELKPDRRLLLHGGEMKTLVTLLLACCFGSAMAQGVVYPQSDLPPCYGNETDWTDCYGSKTFDDGSQYVGEFKGGFPHGHGINRHTNGDMYLGEHKFGKPNGLGTYTFADGTKYVGELLDGKFHGQGTETYPTNYKFVGEFVDGKYNGDGVMYRADGSVAQSGSYIGGFFHRKHYVSAAAFTRIKSNQIAIAKSSKRVFTFYSSTAAKQEKAEQEALEKAELLKQEERARQLAEAEAKRQALLEQQQAETARLKAEQEALEKAELLKQEERARQLAEAEAKRQALLEQQQAETARLKAEQEALEKAELLKQEERARQLAEAEAKRQALVEQQQAETARLKAEQEAQLADAQKLTQPPPASTPQANFTANELEILRAQAAEARRRQAELEAQLAAVQQAQVRPVSPVGPALSVYAIVIGNGAYQGSGRLDNPINDARAISAKLKRMGFKVTTVENADRNKLVSSLVKFSSSAAESDLTLFFYAGHGVQISGTNYMLPTDTNLNQIGGVELHGISLNSVVDRFLPGKTKLVFLDACRDNPLLQVASRSVSRGLAPISVSQGTLISYATKDGSVAADGEGKNSPFTKALLQHIDSPEDIAVVLRKVRDQVMRDTGGQQQPWEYGSLSGGSLILSAIRAK
jgi:hypothetical protein